MGACGYFLPIHIQGHGIFRENTRSQMPLTIRCPRFILLLLDKIYGTRNITSARGVPKGHHVFADNHAEALIRYSISGPHVGQHTVILCISGIEPD